MDSGYAPVNGLKMYYEVRGRGRPLVLLHGGAGVIEMFGPVLESLSRGRMVVGAELQAHGHTADVGRPLRYETMAKRPSTVALRGRPLHDGPGVPPLDSLDFDGEVYLKVGRRAAHGSGEIVCARVVRPRSVASATVR